MEKTLFFCIATWQIMYTLQFEHNLRETTMKPQIKPLAQIYSEAAKAIILNAVFEFQIEPCQTLEQLKKIVEERNAFYDLDILDKTYTNNNGIFLGVFVDNQLVGMGGIRKTDDKTCELRRLFFAKEWRGKGLGSQLLEILIAHARQLGYTAIKLDVYNPDTQKAAVQLYKKFGFYDIDNYNQGPAKLFMQKNL